MSTVVSLDLRKRAAALARWFADCKRRMKLKFPKIDFDSDHWPIHTIYKTDQRDWYFTAPLADFERRDESFHRALRCQVAEIVLAGRPKTLEVPTSGFRLLARSAAATLYEISAADLTKIENALVRDVIASSVSAGTAASLLQRLEMKLVELSEKGVLPHLGFRVSVKTKRELSALESKRRSNRKGAADLLDAKCHAFNDVLEALHHHDPRLDPHDHVVIAGAGMHFCAPSRVNEVLCMAIDDYVEVDDYSKRPKDKERDGLHEAHQLLLLTMKGSKGAQWSAKPALNFLITFFHYCLDVVKRNGTRSRTLVIWYEQHPKKLYLPTELEYLRGKDLTALDIAKVVYLTELVDKSHADNSAHIRAKLRDNAFLKPNSKSLRSNGTVNSKKGLLMYPWAHVERVLLEEVHEAMAACRRVTKQNSYEGVLSKMLFLCDRKQSPFKPWAVNYRYLSQRLITFDSTRPEHRALTVFEKLGITMPVDGVIRTAEMQFHDPRRWLTTQALKHGDKLSDVLINKWANRLNLSQLGAYDYRSAEEKAAASSMPELPELPELQDMSRGIAGASDLEEQFGLRTDILVVHDAGISVTSMNRIMEAVDDRPIARTSNQIIILYPTPFGACLHQHHETPCTRYDSCAPCDENITVKGHLPTNAATRTRADLVRKSVIRQLERLGMAHNRGIADHPETLGEHMLTLTKKGLGVADLADHLIDEFHAIKDLVEDKLLRKRLEEAFATRGIVARLDDQTVPSGALIKYHNPKCHASPGFERALDSHGGREAFEQRERELVKRHPQFGPQELGLQDGRDLLGQQDDDDKD